MNRQSIVVFALLLSAGLAKAASTGGGLTAAEIVDKNVTARGGLEAWRAVRTLTIRGVMGAGGNQRATIASPGAQAASPSTQRGHFGPQAISSRPADEVQLPFVMKLARPRKMRLELEFAGQTALQVYDGANGWKLRPYLDRRVVEPYTEEELKISETQSDLDGELIDYSAKGTIIELDGAEKVEDRDTYKLKLALKNGSVVHLWVDARTFLETKIEGTPRRLDGTMHPVETYFRDYRMVSGVRIPFVLETRVLPVTRTALGLRDTPVPSERTTVEEVIVNAALDDSLFAKPQVLAAAR